MEKRTYPYRPDYATPPGYLVEDYLDALGISAAGFAERHSLSAELINGVIAGDATIDAELAVVFGRELGLDADVWLRIEDTYRCKLVELAAAEAVD